MTAKTLQAIYQVFDHWSRGLPVVCVPSCSCCCTDNVTISAQEGVEILRFLAAEKMIGWFAEALAGANSHPPARMTTNDFALACLEGREAVSEEDRLAGVCPFLDGSRRCRIYPVRPFACRLFASTRRCSAEQAALMPEYYLEAATAMSQLIEHLGQKEYWGNMLDVLPALTDIGEFREIGLLIPPGHAVKARLRTLKAKPLPGFLLSEANNQKVSALLDILFATEVDGKRMEDILNGR